jgi:hypothetical protein
MIDLSSVTFGLPAGVWLSGAGSINNVGQILADGIDGQVYLLTPNAETPEPMSLGLAGTVLAGLFLMRRRLAAPRLNRLG